MLRGTGSFGASRMAGRIELLRLDAAIASSSPASQLCQGVLRMRVHAFVAKCVIAIFDIIDVDCAERRLRLLQGRVRLNLNKLILEITARKGGDDLVALLRRVLVISNPDDIH